MAKKICKICNKKLDLSKFSFRKCSNCYRGHCKQCEYEKRAPRDVDKMRVYYRASNIKKRKQKNEWKKSNRHKHWLQESERRSAIRKRDNLTDSYVIQMLVERTGIPRSLIKKYPALIEAKRQIVKINRYGKTEN